MSTTTNQTETKKPFALKEHLQHRVFAEHEGLQRLRQEMNHSESIERGVK